MGSRVWGCLLVLGMIGCSGNRLTGNDDGAGSATLTVPENLDLEICSVHEYSEEDATASNSECLSCCDSSGFAGFTYHDQRCVCGDPLPDGGESACPGIESLEGCIACCHENRYVGSDFEQGKCECNGLRNSEICSAVVGQSYAAEKCGDCCLEHGYLHMTYGGSETTCDCI